MRDPSIDIIHGTGRIYQSKLETPFENDRKAFEIVTFRGGGRCILSGGLVSATAHSFSASDVAGRARGSGRLFDSRPLCPELTKLLAPLEDVVGELALTARDSCFYRLCLRISTHRGDSNFRSVWAPNLLDAYYGLVETV
jgi:hypothetical protein